ncbi:MAG: type II toxin-antitoxin system PemK/MazF family toxin, partial [Candidatus Woesearchaeota archaeon]
MEKIHIKQKDIFLVPFPFSDLSTSKVRPVLVVSSNTFNKQTHDVIICAISSMYSMHSIPFTQNDIVQGILYNESYIKVSSIHKIEKKLLIKKIAVLNTNTFNIEKKQIITLLQKIK